MVGWTNEQKCYAVERYVVTKSYVTVQRDFRRIYGDHRGRGAAPSATAILRWVTNFREGGSLKKVRLARVNTVRTDATIQRVREAFQRSPRRSAKRHSITLGLSRATLGRILHKDLKFHPYKIQITHHLHEGDNVKRLQFCEKMQELIAENPNFLATVIMSDESNFHLSGYVNKQNFRFWSSQNPRETHSVPLHSEKVVVWCAVTATDVIGPYFFEDENGRATTVNSENYVTMLRTGLIPDLERRNYRINEVWFQQDAATAHTARSTMDFLRSIFPGKVISRFGDVPWPARSPDLTSPDFFLWGYLKEKVYASPIHSIDELKERIREEVRNVSQETLQHVQKSFQTRLEKCIAENGGYLKDLIFKN